VRPTLAHDSSRLPHGAFSHAVIHWLTGVVFASLLALLLIVAGPHIPGLGPMLGDLEVKGVDSAMRVRLVAAPDSGFDARKDPGFVFLDIDPAVCQQAGAGSRCTTRSPAGPGVTAKVAIAALQAEPRVLIVDVALWDTDPSAPSPTAALQLLADAAKAHPGTRVVAVAPFRPTGSDRQGVLDRSLIPQPFADGAIAFAPSFAWRGQYEHDGVMRRYPATVVMSEVGSQAAGRETPTLPYLAALYADAAGDPARLHAIDCQYAGLVTPPRLGCEGAAAHVPSRKLDKSAHAGDEERILFSLPSLVPGPDGERPFEAARFQGRYDVYPASAVMDEKGALRDPTWVKGKIVIVSTSAITALDHHDTPLGDMAGAEVVLNAVKAFLDGGLITEPSLGLKLEHEAVVIAVSSLPYLVFWVLYFLLASRVRGSRFGSVVQPLFATVGFVATVAAAMWLAAIVTIGPLTKGFEEGFALEFFTPIFALSLEGFAEGARWVIDHIEGIIEHGVVRARTMLHKKSNPGDAT
jgi:hypothetical protein